MTTKVSDSRPKSMAARWPAALILACVLGTPETAPARAAETHELQSWLHRQVDSGHALSAAGAVITADGVGTFAAGSLTAARNRAVDSKSQFQLGSLTKPFTHLLLAEMVAAGDMSYDTTVGDLLGEPFEPLNPAVAAITLLQLATHSSGLPRLPANLRGFDPENPYSAYGNDQLMAALVSTRAGQPLGRYYAYSNFGVGLLGHLLGRVHGVGYAEALKQRVLAPLGLERVAFEPSDNHAHGFSGGTEVPAWTFQDSMAGAGALWGSVEDLARLAQVGLGLRDSGLRHATGDDLKVVVTGRDVSVTRVWHVSETSGGPIYWHNGRAGGYGSFLGFRPDTREAMVILVSGDPDPTAFGLQALGHDAARGAPATTAEIDASILGHYRLNAFFEIRVFVDDGVLRAQATGQPAFELFSVDDDRYALGAVDATLSFERDTGRGVTALVLHQNGMQQRAERGATVRGSD